MSERTSGARGSADSAPVRFSNQSVYDQVARRYLRWRYGMPEEMADWILQQDTQHSVRAEAEEMAAFIVDECRGR